MNDRAASPAVPDVEELFALGVGRVSKGLERMQLASGRRIHAGRVAMLLAAVTWLPLLVLAAVVPFLPLIFLVMPAREVLRTLARLLV